MLYCIIYSINKQIRSKTLLYEHNGGVIFYYLMVLEKKNYIFS